MEILIDLPISRVYPPGIWGTGSQPQPCGIVKSPNGGHERERQTTGIPPLPDYSITKIDI